MAALRQSSDRFNNGPFFCHKMSGHGGNIRSPTARKGDMSSAQFILFHVRTIMLVLSGAPPPLVRSQDIIFCKVLTLRLHWFLGTICAQHMQRQKLTHVSICLGRNAACPKSARLPSFGPKLRKVFRPRHLLARRSSDCHREGVPLLPRVSSEIKLT